MGQIQKRAMETRVVGICKRWMAAGSPGTDDSRLEPRGKRVIDAVEDYLESCAQVKVDIDVVERLLRPENFEVSLRYVLKHAAGRGSNIFHLFDTKSRTTLSQTEDDGWKVREETVRGRRMGKTSGTTLSIKEPEQKLRRAPTAPYRLPCLSKARRRPEKKKIIGT